MQLTKQDLTGSTLFAAVSIDDDGDVGITLWDTHIDAFKRLERHAADGYHGRRVVVELTHGSGCVDSEGEQA